MIYLSRKTFKIAAIKSNWQATLFIIIISKLLIFSNSFVYGNPIGLKDTTRHLVQKYYSSGKIKEYGYQGHYSNKIISTGAFVGTWKTYNENGKLIKTIYYYNDIPSKAFIEKKEYYSNGRIKSIEKFNNYELYESDKDSIGTWKYYDPEGQLTKTINHEKKKTRKHN